MRKPRPAQLQQVLTRLIGHDEHIRWAVEKDDFRVVQINGQDTLVFDTVAFVADKIWKDRRAAMVEIANLFQNGNQIVVECRPFEGSETAFAITLISVPRGYRFPEIDDNDE